MQAAIHHDEYTTARRFPWSELLGFLIGVVTPFTLADLGNFPVAEFLLAGLAAWALLARALRGRWPGGAFRTRWFGVFAASLVLSLAGYVIADLYRGSALHDYLRGWARITFVLVDLAGLAVLVGLSWRRWFAVKIGLALGVLLQAVVFGPLFGDWWKFGVGLPVTVLVLALLGNHRWLAVVALLVLGTIHLFMEFRGMGGVCLILAAILAAPAISLQLRLPILALSVITTAILFVTYVQNNGARTGARGSDGERRAMVEAASLAFADSPFIGQGSWFSTTNMVGKIEARRMLNEEGFRGYDAEAADKLAVHSQLLVALAEGGLLGGTFFLVLGAMLLWALFYASATPGPWRPLVLFFLLEAGGNLLISPFSGPARVHIAAATVLVLLLWLERQGRMPGEGRA